MTDPSDSSNPPAAATPAAQPAAPAAQAVEPAGAPTAPSASGLQTGRQDACATPTPQAVQRAGTAALPPLSSLQTSRQDACATPAAGDTPELPPGTELGGYRLEAEIGRGGMGIVYRATQKSLNRPVAVKVLPRRLASDPAFVERFEREALALATLNHPHIVQVIDRGLQGDVCYLVMEFVEGVSLRHVLETQKLTPEQALNVVPQICSALEYAHLKHIIHRDIKPENVLLTADGQVKITDFGLARIVLGDAPPDARRLTQTNVVLGTPDYMAPEQRERASTADHRADIFSLGVIFYEMLTGELPLGRFQAPSHKVVLDVRVDDVVLKSLEKEPALRYQRASLMSQDVEHIQSDYHSTPPAAPLPRAAAGGVRRGNTELFRLKNGTTIRVGPAGVHVIEAPGAVKLNPGAVQTDWDKYAAAGSHGASGGQQPVKSRLSCLAVLAFLLCGVVLVALLLLALFWHWKS